jgi:hypothetical protein
MEKENQKGEHPPGGDALRKGGTPEISHPNKRRKPARSPLKTKNK